MIIGQRPTHPLEHRGAQQQLANLRRLALEHLCKKISRNRPLAARKLGHEALRIGMPAERDRRQPQASRPPLRPLIQQRRIPVRERDPGRCKQLLRPLQGEAQISGSKLRQLTGQTQPMKTKPRILAGRQYQPQPRR
jgi:hypothetical protein